MEGGGSKGEEKTKGLSVYCTYKFTLLLLLLVSVRYVCVYMYASQLSISISTPENQKPALALRG